MEFLQIIVYLVAIAAGVTTIFGRENLVSFFRSTARHATFRRFVGAFSYGILTYQWTTWDWQFAHLIWTLHQDQFARTFLTATAACAFTMGIWQIIKDGWVLFVWRPRAQ